MILDNNLWNLQEHVIFDFIIDRKYEDLADLLKWAPGCCHARGEKGATPLMLASYLGNERMVGMLLPFSDAKAVDKSGMTALMHASYLGNERCAKLLLPFSDVNAKSGRGRTALMIAASVDNDRCLALLLSSGRCDARLVDNEGYSAVMHALACNQTIAAEMLVPSSDLEKPHNYGLTALDMASEIRSQRVVGLMRAKLADDEANELAMFLSTSILLPDGKSKRSNSL